MTDEPKQPDENVDEWRMPEPVFRSSEGYRPGSPPIDAQKDIPTEPGFGDEDEFASPSHGDEEGSVDKPSGQTVRASTKTRVRHTKKRSGCAKTFGMVAGAVALSLAAVILALIYLIVFYRPSGTAF